MIGTKELRIGNLIIYKNEYTIINSITDKGINLYVTEKDRDVSFSVFKFKDLEPIPLTVGILLECEFDIIYSNPRLESFYLNKQTYYPFMIYSSRDGRFYLNENLEIKSVHQLQNLFHALTGEELGMKKMTLQQINK